MRSASNAEETQQGPVVGPVLRLEVPRDDVAGELADGGGVLAVPVGGRGCGVEHVLALDGEQEERGAVFAAMIPELELAALELDAGGVEAVEEVEQGAAVVGEAGGGGGLGHGQGRD